MKKVLATMVFAFSSAASADINLYGPGGPHVALQAAAAQYTQKTGVPITVHYGPQAKWNDAAKKNADILFGASEQSALAIVRDHQNNFSEKDIEPLYLRQSILLVKKGNPKNIKGVEDLSRPGIGIIVNDGGGTSNTSGTGVWEDIAGRKGDIKTVIGIRKNIILFAPNSGSARKALEEQPQADVWITWADWAISNPGIGDVVNIEPDYMIWRDMNITVRKDSDVETRQFAAWLRSDEALPIFIKYGWLRSAAS
ncbi:MULTISPECIES: substrate-binding domain-containing protein [Edwardsiella]|uniref:Accessory colonization factor AcfC n=2 Tax=Edwardsiella anguillarum TaxID=1821960 RepID=A0A076LMS2_9GAMM|nr:MULTISPECIES: substrate-binding domain-containing protein [Edwardsiella]AKM48540.1 ABC transporter ATPase [Edwardsiella sp. EA181011]GAJ67803.1 porcine attaching-effacing associated protein [Edwardsiella piscicida]AIJ09221.1 Accessory colonization factor AcfC [Edwardsiella anguillarum ET080813]AKR77133.1 substrate-binding domain-containing protein [Edwardsiella sp. LADL05-105]KAB0589939.1 accessory colonization factor AcfC [Edwardsiella anguillarum]